DRVGLDVDLADTVEPRERHDDLAARTVRYAAADKAGVATLRHDRRSGLRRELQYAADFGDTARPQHQRRAAGAQSALLMHIGVDVRRVAQCMGWADDRREAVEDGGFDRR